jgi:hypothetical protein
MQGQITLLDLSFVDTVAGGTPAIIATSVPDGGFDFSGKKLVYFRVAATGAGLYVVDLP